MTDISFISVIIYLAYPILLVSISVGLSLTREMGLKSFFFADKRAHWSIISISLITSALFSPYIFGLSISGHGAGLVWIYAGLSAVMFYFTGRHLAPLFHKNNILTLPEYFEKRFNRNTRLLISAVYLIANMFLRLLIIFIAGSILINSITGVESHYLLFFLLIVTSIYLIIGGLRAELYVSILQLGLIVLAAIGFIFWFSSQAETGSITIVNQITSSAGENISDIPYSTAGIIFGLPILAFWFWGADQFVVEKLVSTDSLSGARKTSYLSMALQIIPLVIFALPSIIYLNLENLQSFESFTDAFSTLPPLLSGLFLIGIASVIMSAFSGLLNSTSSLITLDIYRVFYPRSSERKLVLIGRMSILLPILISFLIIPVSNEWGLDIGIKLFSCLCYIAALIGGVFIMALTVKNIGGSSAIYTIVTGLFLICLKTFSELNILPVAPDSAIGEAIIKLGFLEFVPLLFIVSVGLMLVYNRLTGGINKESIPLSSLLINIKPGSHRILLFIFSIIFFAVTIWMIN